MIDREFGVAMNPRYLSRWLWRHGDLTPQLPQRRAAERDEGAVERWVRRDQQRLRSSLHSVPLSWDGTSLGGHY